MSEAPRFQVPNGSTLAEIADLTIREMRRLEDQLAAANARAEAAEAKLATIAETAQGLLPHMNRVDVVTMEASSGIRKLFIQARAAIRDIGAIAKGETP